MRDLHNNIAVKQALETIVVNNDTEGTGLDVDLRGFNAAEMIVDVGASGDILSGTVLHELKLQHSDTGGGAGYTAVTQADVVGGTVDVNGRFALIDDPAEDSVIHTIGYVGPKRFIRLFVDTTGAHTNGTPIAAVAVLSRERHTGGQAV